eukprot:UN10443
MLQNVIPDALYSSRYIKYSLNSAGRVQPNDPVTQHHLAATISMAIQDAPLNIVKRCCQQFGAFYRGTISLPTECHAIWDPLGVGNPAFAVSDR